MWRAFSVTLRASTSSDSAVWNTKASYLNGVYPAHAEHHLFFLKKDNRTVILTRQDFLSDRTADGDLLFTFSSNILDFRRSPSSINWLAARRLISILSLERSPRDPKSSFRSFRLLIKQLFRRETTGSPSSKYEHRRASCWRSSLKSSKDKTDKNSISTR